MNFKVSGNHFNRHPDYLRIRMLQTLLFVAINGGCAADPLVQDLAANFQSNRDRADLIAGLKAELWAVICDKQPGTEAKPIDANTSSGTWLLDDLLRLNMD